MMDYAYGIVVHTPVWVWVLFVFLLVRGVKARRPATVTLDKLIVVPAIFLLWNLYDMLMIHTGTPGNWVMWIAGLLVGAAIGYQFIDEKRIQPGDAPRSLRRPADHTVLPMMMLAFITQYVLGVLRAISPETMQQPGYRAFAIVAGGLFAGTFIGKFVHYVRCYRRPVLQNSR